MTVHHYNLHLRWTGNNGEGTSGYTSYERAHTISIPNKPDLLLSSDPAFRGDAAKYNPEELLLASLSSCHMLWYLHLCAVNNVVILSYEDKPLGDMEETDDGGHFSKVTLRPVVIVSDAKMIAKAGDLHREAHSKCFIARSVNFPVTHRPEVTAESGG